MNIIDISMPIFPEMIVYKDKEEKRPKIEVLREFHEGGVYESRLTLEMHTGTHIDAPLHMIEGGKDITYYPIENSISLCRVLDLSHVTQTISQSHLEDKNIQADEFVLLKTKNSWDEAFNPEFIYLDRDGAKYLAEKKVRGIGIDSLGIERAQPDRGTHITLLKKGIMILEGLRLKHVEVGEYILVATPLNIPGVEASPVRAFLMERNSLNL